MENGEIDIPMLICNVDFAKSKSEGRRLLAQNAVKINGERFSELSFSMEEESFILGVGKNKIVKVVKNNS